MRLFLILLALLFVVAGAVFGALNSERVAIDFYFASTDLPKGAALLGALLLGWIAGGVVVYLGMVLRLRRRLRGLTRELQRQKSAAPDESAA